MSDNEITLLVYSSTGARLRLCTRRRALYFDDYQGPIYMGWQLGDYQVDHLINGYYFAPHRTEQERNAIDDWWEWQNKIAVRHRCIQKAIRSRRRRTAAAKRTAKVQAMRAAMFANQTWYERPGRRPLEGMGGEWYFVVSDLSDVMLSEIERWGKEPPLPTLDAQEWQLFWKKYGSLFFDGTLWRQMLEGAIEDA